MADLDEQSVSPGWTDRGDMTSQQASALDYDKAAQTNRSEAFAAKEITDSQRAYLDSMAQKLGPSMQDRGADRGQEMEQSRGMELSR